MTLVAAGRGTGGNNTSANTITCTPTNTINVGTTGVLCIALDNAGAAGSAAVAPTSVTDNEGNIWTRRASAIYDPGAASAGVETAMYVAENLAVTLVGATDNLVLDFGTAVLAKAYCFWEISSNNQYGGFAQFVSTGNGTGAASAAPTVTTASVTQGNCVIGMGGAESANTWTGDADTTNGSWSSQQATGFGTGTSGMSITSQTKVVTVSATQTYNPTLTSADQILSWMILTEVIAYKAKTGITTGPGLATQQSSRW